MSYHQITKCLACNHPSLIVAFDLHKQPLANSYVQSKDQEEQTYPLGLNYCPACTHLQLTHAVDPDLLFKNYLYVSGTTNTLRQYFNGFVDLSLSYFTSAPPVAVLDIACNDGSQLDAFKVRGFQTYGIDPAQNLHALSSANHEVVCDYLTKNSVNQLSVDEFDIIIAQNVFAHNTYPAEFLKICRDHLTITGRIFIQTSQADMVKYGQFDTIYHEHISFFSVRSMATLVRRVGLYLIDVRKTDIHGTSYVFVISNNANDDRTEYLIEQEAQLTLSDVEKFARNAKLAVECLIEDIDKHRATHMIVGYGAAAKGNTVLNYGGITLDYIVDDNPLKCGLFTPGRKIEIVSFDQVNAIAHQKPIAWIPLSWNFFKEIQAKIAHQRNNSNDRFIQLKFAQL